MGLISGGGRRGRGGFGMAYLLLLIVGVSWLRFSSVEGVRCYACQGADCKTGAMDCTGDDLCRTVTVTEGGDKKSFGKSCGDTGAKEGCQGLEEPGKRTKTCHCKGDHCNGALAFGGTATAHSSTKKYSPSLMILLAASTLTARHCKRLRMPEYSIELLQRGELRKWRMGTKTYGGDTRDTMRTKQVEYKKRCTSCRKIYCKIG